MPCDRSVRPAELPLLPFREQAQRACASQRAACSASARRCVSAATAASSALRCWSSRAAASACSAKQAGAGFLAMQQVQRCQLPSKTLRPQPPSCQDVLHHLLQSSSSGSTRGRASSSMAALRGRTWRSASCSCSSHARWRASPCSARCAQRSSPAVAASMLRCCP